MKLKPFLVWSIILLGLSWTIIIGAQSAPDSPLNRFQGSWEGPGKAFGMDARLRMKWEWVLGNKFVRLNIINEMRNASGKSQVFEGHAYYAPAVKGDGSGFEARWFDSRGVSFPIKANMEGDALVALWGTPEQEQGRSTYRLIEPGKLEVVDSVKQKDGTWREFGRFVVSKQ
jgi:hypothetical protein